MDIGKHRNKRTVLLVRNVANNGFGGGEVYQLNLAERLKKKGLFPIIVTNSNELIQCARSKGFVVLRSPFLKQQNWSGWRNLLLFRYVFFQKKLEKWYSRVIEKYHPVVINIQSRDDYIAATRAARKDEVRILWTDHADFCNWVLWNVNKRFKNMIGKEIIKLSSKADKVIFVSETVMKKTSDLIYPKELKNAIMIHNGVEDRLNKYSDTKIMKNSFVFIGRVVEDKGIGEMIEAIKKVAKRYSEVELNIYGDGELEKFKKIGKGCDAIRFHGQTDEPLKALAENEIFVLPSYREGLSLSLLDAAMMGKKIIASNVDGNPEVVIDGETGLLVPAKDADKLAEAMMWMLEHKKEADKMAKNARTRYEKQFDFKKIFEEKMLPLYNSVKEEK